MDESLLTGESAPVRKQAGDKVVGGSVNGTGSIAFKVTSVSGETRLDQIARMVEDAQGSKAPVQQLADKVSSIFVPVVIAIATLTFLVRFLGFHSSLAVSMLPAIAVLVIACPCALGLATPTAIVAATGRGAQLGILIRDGAVLQQVQSLRTILFDKTGTLTEGKPIFAGIETSGHFTEPETLALAASLEQLSEHPIGKAIVNRSLELNLALSPVTEFQSQSGAGISGVVNRVRVEVGSEKSGAQTVRSKEWAEKGATVVEVRADSVVIGVIAVNDQIRPSSAEAISELKAMGFGTAMITGDAQVAAELIASQAHIDHYSYRVIPEQKAAEVAKYRSSGAVCFVGDGVNDAPALAAADVGVAMGGGSDIAKEVAGITLLKSDLRAVPQAIRLARATMTTIRGNLAWAFGYNVIAIPIAITGKLNPMIAAGAMAFSSIAVVLNSLRLLSFR